MQAIRTSILIGAIFFVHIHYAMEPEQPAKKPHREFRLPVIKVFNPRNRLILGGISLIPNEAKLIGQSYQSPAVVDRILQLHQGAYRPLDKLDRFQCAPIHYAAQGGYTDALRKFLEHGANPHIAYKNVEEAPLIFAIFYDRLETVGALLEPIYPNPTSPGKTWHANPNKKTKKLAQDKGLVYSSLHWAIKWARVGAVRILLARGARLDVRTGIQKGGRTALELANYYLLHTRNEERKEKLRTIITILNEHIVSERKE